MQNASDRAICKDPTFSLGINPHQMGFELGH